MTLLPLTTPISSTNKSYAYAVMTRVTHDHSDTRSTEG